MHLRKISYSLTEALSTTVTLYLTKMRKYTINMCISTQYWLDMNTQSILSSPSQILITGNEEIHKLLTNKFFSHFQRR